MEMTILHSIVLGVLQGIAEFLPISSSGHLAVAEKLFGLEEVPLLFDVILHLATLCSVVLVFRKKIAELLCVLGRWIIHSSKAEDKAGLRLIVAIIVATACTGVLGLVIEKYVSDLITEKVIGAFFIVTALLLIFSARYTPKKNVMEPGIKEGIITGLAQGIGVLPGISRSGITISASLLSGVDRAAAGEYSFLLSIPAILGAFILHLKDADTMTEMVPTVSLIAGFIAAFVAGLAALTFLMKLIKKGSLNLFAWYLIPAGILCIIFL